ncbi:hypothetical protein QBC32DRAFT_366099 [Pseudoneurospora amorphoporcata]|uniref:Uncharacterized protein n=1 Tax=Pseudoneurospora amorphoporcata TaxID=241081 RepID=A0AAN6NJF9_9PEZI|nr:hypothetical protein QBC32DRAFT_366099 [Pseudoneurospora amorphoporcata]
MAARHLPWKTPAAARRWQYDALGLYCPGREIARMLEPEALEPELDVVARALKVQLASLGLKPYITTTIPTPEVKAATKTEDEKALAKWHIDRAKVMGVIHSTINNDNIQSILIINGWDEDNDDPKYLFDLIRNSISSVTNEAKSDVLNEYQTLKRASFTSLESFLMRYQALRKRMKDVGYFINDNVELTNLFNAIKHSYPVDAKL